VNYLDTSALIKRFVEESGSASVQALIAESGVVATSKIAYAEAYAGLTRRRREGHFSEKEYRVVCRNFEKEWRAYLRVDLKDDVLTLARDVIKRNPLRGFDAVHLASALHLARGLGEQVVFVASDSRLLGAARREKLQVWNPEAG
jgi:predicted nucleic acid-binding protein